MKYAAEAANQIHGTTVVQFSIVNMNILQAIRIKHRSKKGRKNEYREWKERHFAAPSPSDIKRAVLVRHSRSNVTWVETGTFMGDTAALLAKHSKHVHTIEPDKTLHEKAATRFENDPKVNAIRGVSEEVFPQLLPTLNGAVNFWLDGHYSGGITFQGTTDCPVRDELLHIEKNMENFEKVIVLIDDIRCFRPEVPEFSDYPDLDYLVDWARRNSLSWSIEHDIFIAKNKS